jgi:hypothetical protein
MEGMVIPDQAVAVALPAEVHLVREDPAVAAVAVMAAMAVGQGL